MNTNFFEALAGLNAPGNWKLTIHTTDNHNFTVSALFTALHCGDQATKAIPPMLLKGTAEELADGFFEAIAQPVAVTAGLYHNMEAYLKEVEAARLKSKEEQDKKKAQTTTDKAGEGIETDAMKQAKAEKKEAYEAALKEIEQLRAQMKYSEALALLPSVTDYPDRKAELEKKKSELENLVQLKAKSLFA